MPFADGFEDIDRIISDAVDECGLVYVRGDRSRKPGSVVSQIVEQIRQATIVVADITNNNPNVFYELGIAHQLLGPERVVIIAQRSAMAPYDVHEFRQLIYSHTEDGRQKLRSELPAFLKAALESCTDSELWNVIRGRLWRTVLVSQDLQQFVEHAGKGDLKGVVIRMVAGLGSLAISDDEPVDPELGNEYQNALIAERDLLREALVLGAEMKLVLNPPRRFAKGMLPERLSIRYRRLIGLLNGVSDIRNNEKAEKADLIAINQCQIALTPVSMPNLIIIGESVAYEGMKRGATRGFEMTHRETNTHRIRELIEQYDQLYDDSAKDMRSRKRLADQLREFLKEAEGHTS